MMNKIPAILGGEKLRKIPFESRTTIGPEEKKAVIEVMDSDVLSAFIGAPGEKFLGGDKVLEFENNWKEYTNLPHAHFISSDAVGLHLALNVLRKRNG